MLCCKTGLVLISVLITFVCDVVPNIKYMPDVVLLLMHQSFVTTAPQHRGIAGKA